LPMFADVARAGAFGDVHVQTLAMDVADEKFAAVLGGPALAEVTHQAGVGVTAAGGVAPGVGGVRAGLARPVNVVRHGLEVVVGVGIDGFAAALVAEGCVPGGFLRADAKMLPALPFVAPAAN